MRELTKSVTSYTWAMSVFWTQQMFNVFGFTGSGAWDRSTRSFNNVTEVTTNEMGDTMRAVFRGGDTLQRGMVDLFLAPFSLGNWAGGGNRTGAGTENGGNRNGGNGNDGGDVTRMTADVTRATADAASRAARSDTQPQGNQGGPPAGAPPSLDPSLGWGPMPR
jgi:hypothetical protein